MWNLGIVENVLWYYVVCCYFFLNMFEFVKYLGIKYNIGCRFNFLVCFILVIEVIVMILCCR